MATDNPIYGQDEILVMIPPTTTYLDIPFTLTGSVNGNIRSDVALLFIGNTLIKSSTITNNEFNIEYTNSDSITLNDYLVGRVDCITSSNGNVNSSQEFSIPVIMPSIAMDLYKITSLFRNILEDDFNISTNDDDGLKTLIEIVEAM